MQIIKFYSPDKSDQYVYNFGGQTEDRIFLNLSRHHYFDAEPSDIDPEIISALDLVTSLQSNVPSTAEHLKAADFIFESGLCISPYTIFSPLHKDVCTRLNANSDLATDLKDELAAVGAFDFVSRVHSQSMTLAIIERTISIFTSSSIGATKLTDIPLEFIHTVADFFRSEDGMGWNRELFKESNVKTQCVANIIKGFARIYDDESLARKSRRNRTPKDISVAWSWLQLSTQPLSRELLELHKKFSEDSRMNPQQLKNVVVAINSWLATHYPGKSIAEMITGPERNVTFSDFAMTRNEPGLRRMC